MENFYLKLDSLCFWLMDDERRNESKDWGGEELSRRGVLEGLYLADKKEWTSGELCLSEPE